MTENDATTSTELCGAVRTMAGHVSTCGLPPGHAEEVHAGTNGFTFVRTDEEVAALPMAVVPESFRMDPETDTARWGADLQPGMVVLAGEAYARRPSAWRLDDGKEERAEREAALHLVHSRWCEVTSLRVESGRSSSMSYDGRPGPDVVHFIGRYADGTEVHRHGSVHSSWYVKRLSIPDPEAEIRAAFAAFGLSR